MSFRSPVPVLLAFVLASGGCGAQRASVIGSPATPPPPDWVRVAPPTTGVGVMMPQRPRIERRIGRESDGAYYQTISARTEVGFGAFGMIVTEYEGGMIGDPLVSARDVADGLFQTQQLAQRRSHRLTIPGFYAREDTGVAPNGVFVALRQFVGRTRIYVAMAIVPNQPGPLAAAQAFMGSISLDGADALLPEGDDPNALFMPDSDFAVNMPRVSTRSTEEFDVGEAHVVAHDFVAQGEDERRWRVRVLEFADGVEPGMLDRVIAQLALGERGAPVSASGFPGAAFARTNDGTDVQGRIYQTASRIYVLELSRPSDESSADDAQRFFDSFRIL